jgi:hypothetical protein
MSGLGWDVLLTTTWEASMSWSLLWDATSGLTLYWRVAWNKPSGDRRGAMKAAAERGAHRGMSRRIMFAMGGL